MQLKRQAAIRELHVFANTVSPKKTQLFFRARLVDRKKSLKTTGAKLP